MRVTNIDMRNNSHTCPSGLSLISSPKRLCDITSYGPCVSNSFSVQDFQYSHVCGKIIGYQNRLPLAFYYRNHWHDIDSRYVYGVSLTHVKAHATTSGLLLVQGMKIVIALGGSVPV